MKDISINKKLYNKNLLALLITFFILVILFLFSLIEPKVNKDINSVNSALVNKKYNICKIELSAKDKEKITLHNLSDFWIGEYQDFINTTNKIYFSCNLNLVNEFIFCSKEIIKLNTVKSLKNINKTKLEKLYLVYGLDEKNAICVSYFNEQDECISKIFFGALNESEDKIFIRTSKSDTIYSIPSKIIFALNTNLNDWTEKNLLPQSVSFNLTSDLIQNFTYSKDGQSFSDTSDANIATNTSIASEKLIQKFPSLRFSEIITNFELGKKVLELKICDGKGSEYLYSFYKANTINGNCYAVKLQITPSEVLTLEQKTFLKKINAYYSISEWTFNSIIELL